MANEIRIKRSASTNAPSSLSQGEMANSETGSPNGVNELFIGTTGPTVYKLIRNLNAAPAEPTAGLADAVLGSTDYLVFEDVSDSQGKRELVSDIPLSLFNDTGYVNQTITTGLGIDGAEAGSTGDITISFDPNELATAAPLGGDYLVFEDLSDSNLPKKQLFSGIPISLWGAATTQVNMADNDLNRAVLEDYGVKHQTPTVSANAVSVDCTLGNSVAIDMDPATAAVTLTLSNPPASGTYGEVTLEITMGTPAYGMIWPGSITWQNGGSAPVLTTTDNAVDFVHLSTTDGGTTWYGTYALAAGSATGVSSVTASTGITVAGTGADPTVAVDYLGTDNFIDSATNLEGTAIATTDTIVYHDATDNNVKKGLVSDLPFGIGSGDISRVNITAGIGLTGTVDTLTGDHTQTLDFDFSELTDMTGTIAGTTEFILQDGTTESRKAASEIKLEFFDYSTWLIDEDTMVTDSATRPPSQQSVKAYVDSVASSEMTYKGGWNASTNTPNLNTITSAVGDMYTVTVAGTTPFTTGPNVSVQIGDVMIAESTGVLNDIANWTILENNQNAATISTPGYVSVGAQTFGGTKTFEDIAGNNSGATLDSFIIDGGTF
jgi:hypothetical protein